jgi:hypothetical protein
MKRLLFICLTNLLSLNPLCGNSAVVTASSKWSTANLTAYADIKTLQIDSDEGEIHIKSSSPITSTVPADRGEEKTTKSAVQPVTTVAYDNPHNSNVTVEKVGNVLKIKNKSRFWQKQKSADFYIITSKTVDEIRINIGKGVVILKNCESRLEIKGGKIDIYGQNISAPVDFSCGKGTVNLANDAVHLTQSLSDLHRGLNIGGGHVVFFGKNIFAPMKFSCGNVAVNLVYDVDAKISPVSCFYKAGKITLDVFLNREFKNVENTPTGGKISFESFLPAVVSGDADFTISGKAGFAEIKIKPVSAG